MNKKKELAGKQLESIRSYLILKAVPSDLRSRILEYYRYVLTSSQELAGKHMFDNMPTNLAAQLALSVNRKIAGRCAFFRDVSNSCLLTLITDLQPLVYVPGQTVVAEGFALANVHFINKGLVRQREGEHECGTLTDHDNFGLDDFLLSCLTGSPPVVRKTVEAVTYCDMMLLSLERLTEATKHDETFQDKLRQAHRKRNHGRLKPRCTFDGDDAGGGTPRSARGNGGGGAAAAGGSILVLGGAGGAGGEPSGRRKLSLHAAFASALERMPTLQHLIDSDPSEDAAAAPASAEGEAEEEEAQEQRAAVARAHGVSPTDERELHDHSDPRSPYLSPRTLPPPAVQPPAEAPAAAPQDEWRRSTESPGAMLRA